MVFSNFTLKRLDVMILTVERMNETIRGAQAAVDRLTEALAYEDAKENGFRSSFTGGVEDPPSEQARWRYSEENGAFVYTEGSESVQESSPELGTGRKEKDDAHQEAIRQRDIDATTDKLQGWSDWLGAKSPPGKILDYIQEARRVRLHNEHDI